MATRVSGRDPETGQPRTVVIQDGRISDILPGGPDDGLWLSLGLFDLQLNGFGGHDLNARPDPETVRDLATAVHESGVSRFAPTLITASHAAIIDALQAISQARDSDPLVRHAIPFVHIEGPHIAPEDGARGAHPAEHVRPPSLSEFDAWQAASGNLVGLVTMSPHWPETSAYVHGLQARGVRVALGHTSARSDQISAAVAAGAILSTHLGNGIAVTLPRHPNPIWTQLAEDRLWASFIADGHHLPPETFKAMLRAKGLERSILVSDAVALAGCAPGIYNVPIGGKVELKAAGRLEVVGTSILAGAAVSLTFGIATARRMAGLTLAEALRLATINPRMLFNLPALTVGAPADLLRFRLCEDGSLAPETVYVAGRPYPFRP
ncbi:amidohydrolase family protein [Bradyrhizobium sp. CCGUVB1N3]|uniref:N-acetylglucosamine-6-phosphate deacetylase n=1 Tax=Bradyrhizobium sp. CCGUVB1N3 TaxID=2949629 RepID=UPI0020B23FD1|nr:amidohydrolase family protein [Bradyrhizobium sp. CCGUVB1N3]MCP3474871.1 amidohydrolase family protein [Bradyrhizobium sp. CCGUVB1N3]